MSVLSAGEIYGKDKTFNNSNVKHVTCLSTKIVMRLMLGIEIKTSLDVILAKKGVQKVKKESTTNTPALFVDNLKAC